MQARKTNRKMKTLKSYRKGGESVTKVKTQVILDQRRAQHRGDKIRMSGEEYHGLVEGDDGVYFVDISIPERSVRCQCKMFRYQSSRWTQDPEYVNAKGRWLCSHVRVALDIMFTNCYADFPKGLFPMGDNDPDWEERCRYFINRGGDI